MAKKPFDYQGAKNEGYSDEEIMEYLRKTRKGFDFEAAVEEGYSPNEINQYLSTSKPKSIPEKAARVGAQFGLGLAEGALIPYELGVAPLASKEAQHAEYRKNLFEDIERLQEQKATGIWDQQDQDLYNSLVDQVKSPEKSNKFVKTANIGARGLAEKITGQDLHPEGVLEKAANWTGFIKNPSNIKTMVKMGINPKSIAKAITPGKDAMRGLGAGTGLQLAEEGNFGPIGSIAATIVGDVAALGVKGGLKALSQPKKTVASLFAKTANKKSSIVKDLSEASQGKKFIKDIGTLTDNNVVQMIQARLAASGFTGKPLENLRKEMTKEIVEEYEKLSNKLGEARFETLHEAGEVGKETLKHIRDSEKNRISNIYDEARSKLNERSVVRPHELEKVINELDAMLKPGSVKSSEQKSVLNVLEELKKDIYDAQGNLKPVSVKDLMNNNVALKDIVNFEVQGGQKQLLKHLIKEIDKSIIEHSYDKAFVKDFMKANKEFAEHAKTFRNDVVSRILTSEDPRTLINKMNSVHGIKEIRKAMSKSEEGKELFNALSRQKLDLMFNNAFYDGAREQIKMGTFSNVLKKGKNREIVKELLDPEAYSRLISLQNHTGKLAKTAEKFLNTSQSATTYADMKTGANILTGIFGMLTGNPWALSFASGIGGARILSGLMADPKFLKLAEEAIIASQKGNEKNMQISAKNLADYAKFASRELVRSEDSM